MTKNNSCGKYVAKFISYVAKTECLQDLQLSIHLPCQGEGRQFESGFALTRKPLMNRGFLLCVPGFWFIIPTHLPGTFSWLVKRHYGFFRSLLRSTWNQL